MNFISKHIHGDRAIWAIVALLSMFSFLPVYSASSNLVYVLGVGSVTGHLVKHVAIVLIGISIMYAIHRIPFKYFSGLSLIALPIVWVLLLYTALQGNIIDGANASRWIKIPILGLSFQTSTLASVVLMIYVARYLSINKEKQIRFLRSLLVLWLPVLLVVGTILPSNLSTAVLLIALVFTLAFIGGYPKKYIFAMLGTAALFLTLFIVTVKAYPNAFPNRVDTWMSRIESFSGDGDANTNYQVQRAKTAIATGGVLGKGAGKSVMKNLLPQSTSDFIYAIITEEYGMVGGLSLLFLYLLLLFRIFMSVYKTEHFFGQLLIVGVGLPIIIQSLVNMGVAVSVLPVTGQPLPLISSGGTSIWMTFLALGIVQSVTADRTAADDDDNNPLAILSETV
ncbi:MAG: FtsW/RodA/SpoVE family cell cycle protein [Flavobacteriaceae bacterium]|nr:FtsW/RodA/SpoVE family cell cycle protein [Flavobacteriaceae bacterium]